MYPPLVLCSAGNGYLETAGELSRRQPSWQFERASEDKHRCCDSLTSDLWLSFNPTISLESPWGKHKSSRVETKNTLNTLGWIWLCFRNTDVKDCGPVRKRDRCSLMKGCYYIIDYYKNITGQYFIREREKCQACSISEFIVVSSGDDSGWLQTRHSKTSDVFHPWREKEDSPFEATKEQMDTCPLRKQQLSILRLSDGNSLRHGLALKSITALCTRGIEKRKKHMWSSIYRALWAQTSLMNWETFLLIELLTKILYCFQNDCQKNSLLGSIKLTLIVSKFAGNQTEHPLNVFTFSN